MKTTWTQSRFHSAACATLREIWKYEKVRASKGEVTLFQSFTSFFVDVPSYLWSKERGGAANPVDSLYQRFLWLRFGHNRFASSVRYHPGVGRPLAFSRGPVCLSMVLLQSEGDILATLPNPSWIVNDHVLLFDNVSNIPNESHLSFSNDPLYF